VGSVSLRGEAPPHHLSELTASWICLGSPPTGLDQHVRQLAHLPFCDLTPGPYMSTRPAGYWVTRSALSGAVSITRNASPNRPSADSLEPASFPPVASPLRSFFVRPPRRSFRSRRPARVPSLFAAPPMASTLAGLPNLPLRSVPRFSQPLDGFRHPRFRGPIASRSHVQGSPFRGFSRSTAAPTRRRCVPPCRCSSEASPANRLPPSDASASRPCSVDRCVPQERGLASPSVAPLLGFAPPSGPGYPSWTRFPGASTRDVSHLVFPPG
jgi:hypothetical protein